MLPPSNNKDSVLYYSFINIVPTPRSENISISSECFTLLSIICVRGTPPFNASKQHSIFGIIPSDITPVAIIEGIASRQYAL